MTCRSISQSAPGSYGMACVLLAVISDGCVEIDSRSKNTSCYPSYQETSVEHISPERSLVSFESKMKERR